MNEHEEELEKLLILIKETKEKAKDCMMSLLLQAPNKEAMKEVIRSSNRDVVQMLSELALPREHYEICQAVKEVMEEKE